MILDPLEKIINLKIVYFGPALSGKTTSLIALFSHFGNKNEVISIENSLRRTLFFDYGTIKFQNTDWLLKVHVYSTTGQDFYLVTRPITLRAVDGIIFIVDSQRSAYRRNIISWNELNSYFGERSFELPIVIAFNKQDLPEKFEISKFLEDINHAKYKNVSVKKTIAVNGEGILTCFEEILQLIFTGTYHANVITSVSQRT
ncbi:MAG: GTP-binding protein [Promethearchaeota archaeon]